MTGKSLSGEVIAKICLEAEERQPVVRIWRVKQLGSPGAGSYLVLPGKGKPGNGTKICTRSITLQDSLKFYKAPLGYESVKSEDSLKLYEPIVS